jgi:hypothetical protein
MDLHLVQSPPCHEPSTSSSDDENSHGHKSGSCGRDFALESKLQPVLKCSAECLAATGEDILLSESEVVSLAAAVKIEGPHAFVSVLSRLAALRI